MTEFLVLSSFVFPVGAIALIVLVVAAVSGRGEPDPTGRRPYAAYLFVVSFLALFTMVFAGFAMVSSLVDLATRDSDDSIQFEDSSDSFDSDSDSGSGSVTGFIRDPETGEIIGSRGSQSDEELSSFDEEQDNEDIRTAVQSGLVTLIAGLVLAFHAGRALRLVDEPGFRDSPSRRLYQGYLYAVCFVAMLTAIGALAAAGYGGFRALAPGIAASGSDDETREGLAELVSAGLLALTALLIFLYHWRRAEGVLSPPGAPPYAVATAPGPQVPPSPPPAPPPPPPPPPPAPEPDPETWAPRPPE